MHVILVAILSIGPLIGIHGRRLSVYTECSTLFPFDVLQEMLCGMSTVNCEFSREQGGFSNCVRGNNN